ncbi:MAG: DoxX family protein [Alphaproteobacteria bacterium]|nr:DoxX family protein [Alphaproteobacteria bacterium]MBU2378406.1 DoxX family protein [Alphaproteobacteria bacterium]
MASFNTASLSRWQPEALAILRIVAGVTFMAHGIIKLFGFPDGAQPGQQEIASLMGVAGILETFGGLLIVLGLFTRPTAFVLSGMMAVAYWMAHAPSSPYPAVNGGDAAILFCFVFLYFVTSGPGAWSVDEMRKG